MASLGISQAPSSQIDLTWWQIKSKVGICWTCTKAWQIGKVLRLQPVATSPSRSFSAAWCIAGRPFKALQYWGLHPLHSPTLQLWVTTGHVPPCTLTNPPQPSKSNHMWLVDLPDWRHHTTITIHFWQVPCSKALGWHTWLGFRKMMQMASRQHVHGSYCWMIELKAGGGHWARNARPARKLLVLSWWKINSNSQGAFPYSTMAAWYSFIDSCLNTGVPCAIGHNIRTKHWEDDTPFKSLYGSTSFARSRAFDKSHSLYMWFRKIDVTKRCMKFMKHSSHWHFAVQVSWWASSASAPPCCTTHSLDVEKYWTWCHHVQGRAFQKGRWPHWLQTSWEFDAAPFQRGGCCLPHPDLLQSIPRIQSVILDHPRRTLK